MVALVGPNGVGKTTLLKLASRLLPPASGEILLEGKAAAAAGRGASCRAPSRWFRRSSTSLSTFRWRKSSPRAACRISRCSAPARIWIAKRSRRRCRRSTSWACVIACYSELSGGERQRVKIAIGLAQQPQLMLLDEPTQHLDIGRQIELIELLRCLNESGITILAAIHDLNLVAENFSSVIMLTPEPSWIAGPSADVLAARSRRACVFHRPVGSGPLLHCACFASALAQAW